MKTSEITTLFVDLALKYDWGKIKELPDEEVQILLATVSAAGFNPTKVVPGKLVGYYRDQSGSSTGKKYLINGYCPYKVISRDGGDHYHATGWLDRAIHFARGESDREKRVKAIQHEIERSVPMKPIQLTAEGDMLREYPPSDDDYFVDHTRDNHTLSSCVGVHDFCNCWMDRKRATQTHDAVLCSGCHLRVLFPKEIKTYGQLREHLESKFAQVPA